MEMKGGIFTGERSYFSSRVIGANRLIEREGFEWRKLDKTNRGDAGQKDGFKLVMVRTREVIATFEKDDDSAPGIGTLGYFKFHVEEERLGEECEVMAVISLLGVIEKERRRGGSRTNGLFKDRCGLGGFLN